MTRLENLFGCSCGSAPGIGFEEVVCEALGPSHRADRPVLAKDGVEVRGTAGRQRGCCSRGRTLTPCCALWIGHPRAENWSPACGSTSAAHEAHCGEQR